MQCITIIVAMSVAIREIEIQSITAVLTPAPVYIYKCILLITNVDKTK